jgi:hypothetical protein
VIFYKIKKNKGRAAGTLGPAGYRLIDSRTESQLTLRELQEGEKI